MYTVSQTQIHRLLLIYVQLIHRQIFDYVHIIIVYVRGTDSFMYTDYTLFTESKNLLIYIQYFTESVFLEGKIVLVSTKYAMTQTIDTQDTATKQATLRAQTLIYLWGFEHEEKIC